MLLRACGKRETFFVLGAHAEFERVIGVGGFPEVDGHSERLHPRHLHDGRGNAETPLIVKRGKVLEK